MVKIFIDAGHGGSDPGAVGNGLKEKDLTLDIAKRIRKYLRDNYNGHNIKMSRTSDKTLSLKQRTDMANRWGADYLLSIHINAGGGTGYEDFIYNGAIQAKTASLRNTIHAEIIKQVSDWQNRGKKKANFHMLRESRMPAMLSENGFIDTKADAAKLKSSAYLNKIAKGHAVGVAKALGLKRKNKGTITKPSNAKPAKRPASKPKPNSYKGNSLVDYLKSIGRNSSFANRKKLAVQNGIKNYVGTASQNTNLLKKLRSGSTAKPKPKKLRVGSKVKIKSSAKKYSRADVTIPNRFKGKTYTIQQVGKNDVLIKELYSWVKKTDVQ